MFEEMSDEGARFKILATECDEIQVKREITGFKV